MKIVICDKEKSARTNINIVCGEIVNVLFNKKLFINGEMVNKMPTENNNEFIINGNTYNFFPNIINIFTVSELVFLDEWKMSYISILIKDLVKKVSDKFEIYPETCNVVSHSDFVLHITKKRYITIKIDEEINFDSDRDKTKYDHAINFITLRNPRNEPRETIDDLPALQDYKPNYFNIVDLQEKYMYYIKNLELAPCSIIIADDDIFNLPNGYMHYDFPSIKDYLNVSNGYVYPHMFKNIFTGSFIDLEISRGVMNHKKKQINKLTTITPPNEEKRIFSEKPFKKWGTFKLLKEHQNVHFMTRLGNTKDGYYKVKEYEVSNMEMVKNKLAIIKKKITKNSSDETEKKRDTNFEKFNITSVENKDEVPYKKTVKDITMINNSDGEKYSNNLIAPTEQYICYLSGLPIYNECYVAHIVGYKRAEISIDGVSDIYLPDVLVSEIDEYKTSPKDIPLKILNREFIPCDYYVLLHKFVAREMGAYYHYIFKINEIYSTYCPTTVLDVISTLPYDNTYNNILEAIYCGQSTVNDKKQAIIKHKGNTYIFLSSSYLIYTLTSKHLNTNALYCIYLN
jgi:hypothetical protein